jgi:outer membrane biosynthesis protein TonB
MSYKNVGNQKGFAHLVILVGVVVVVAVAGAGLSVKRHKDHENALQLQRQNASQKIAKETAPNTSNHATEQTMANGTPTTPTPAATNSTPTPTPTPKPVAKSTPSTTQTNASTPTPTPAPTPTPPPAPTMPTTVDFSNGDPASGVRTTYNCKTFNLLYAVKSPTYSYSSPNGAQLNSYPQWANISGVTCASTPGWVQRGNEYFYGMDLVYS